MKRWTGCITCLFVVIFAGSLEAGEPDLEEGVYIYNGSAPLDLSGYSSPTVSDWDNDGRKDLLVGHINGYVWLFLNQGTNLNPLFNGGTLIESSGIPIHTSTS